MAKRLFAAMPYLVMLVLGAAIVGLLGYILPYRYGLAQNLAFQEASPPQQNPLTGFAPPAQNHSACQDTNLVYIGLTWAMWEPEEGFYDIETLEETFHIAEWKQQGKHAVLRFVCDLPGDEEHLDIPAWLYEKTGDGAFYANDYGRGYAPDYANPYLMARHARALEALAEYCNQDTFVAYVELGSLGHWGEWHTDRHAAIPQMPDAALCRRYVQDYTTRFTHARLLMRRNYAAGVEAGLGIYNDMLGAEDSTELWLDWMREGGSYSTQGAPLEFTPVERFWERAPGGGELTSRYPMDELLGRRLITTLETVQRSHVSFIGPHCPTGARAATGAAATLLEYVGYRYYVSALRADYSFRTRQLEVTLHWKSVGAAPLYWDWPVTLYVYDRDGVLQHEQRLDLQLPALPPGEEAEVCASVPFPETLRAGYQLGVGIQSPDGRERILLAMDVPQREDGVQILCTCTPH